MRAPHLLYAFMTCAVIGVGCNRRDAAIDTQQARQEAREAAAVAGDRIADSWLATKIQAQYFADDDIRARDISVTANDGVVTLKGRVPDENAHTQALQTARNTDGVSQVVDELVVAPEQQKAETDTRPTASGAVATAGAALDDARITSTVRSEEHTSELQSRRDHVCRLLLEKKKGIGPALSLS